MRPFFIKKKEKTLKKRRSLAIHQGGLLHDDRAPVMTLRRMWWRACVFVFNCIHCSRSTTQFPPSHVHHPVTGTGSGAAMARARICIWYVPSMMQLWTIETSPQSVIKVLSSLMAYRDTCQTIMSPPSVCSCPTETRSNSAAMAILSCGTA